MYTIYGVGTIILNYAVVCHLFPELIISFALDTHTQRNKRRVHNYFCANKQINYDVRFQYIGAPRGTRAAHCEMIIYHALGWHTYKYYIYIYILKSVKFCGMKSDSVLLQTFGEKLYDTLKLLLG